MVAPFSRHGMLLALVGLLALLACQEEGRNEQKPSLPAGPEYLFTLSLGEKQIEVQLAVTSAEMQRGLMYRSNLDPDEGMLFVYRQPQRMKFWMRHTFIPLDIGFFDSKGVLHEIYPLYPHDETSVSSRSKSIQYALEMKQGWFSANGIKPDATLDLNTLKAALRDRGFDSVDYQIP